MAQTARNDLSHEQESFPEFYEKWLIQQAQDLQDLISASESYKLQNQLSEHKYLKGREMALNKLIRRVVNHYDRYYFVKSKQAERDVLSVLSPSWKSTLEDSHLWIGGWRPTLAFQLLYSKSGVQLEAGLAEFIRGVVTRDLGGIGPRQLEQIDELHMRILREEKEVTEKMAKMNEMVVDADMVEMSHVVSAMMREEREVSEDRVEMVIEEKEKGLKEFLEIADELRLKSLRGAVELLTPIQAVHFLIAAAELHLRIHEWGKIRDARRNNQAEEQQQDPLAVGSS